MPAPMDENRPVVQGEQPANFKAAREKHEAQLKATKDKMDKLVAEYKKMKPGKKRDAKKAEIVVIVTDIRDQQILFKEKNLAGFEKRLNHMKNELAQQSAPEARKAWVDVHTEKLIEQNGDLRVLFDRPEGGPDKGMHSGKKPFRGSVEMKGHGGPKGPQGPAPDMAQPGVLPPPAPVTK